MNILIIDDHPTNLKLLRAILEAEGLTVFDAADGVEALQVLEREKIDAVISDILMPRMDGYRLCFEVRKNERLQNLPFIMYTASYISLDDEKLALNLGADKFIRKPASAHILMDVLREVTTEARYRQPRRIHVLPEIEILNEYNERLVSKLEEKNAELTAETAALADSRQKLDAIIHSVDGIVCEIDPQTFQFTFVSQRAERLLGYACERWLQEPNFWRDHIHPEDREWAVNFCVNATAEKKDHEFEYRMLAANGRVVWLRDIVTVIIENDRPSKLRSLMVDITERKQSEVQLQASHEQLRALAARLQTIREEQSTHIAREIHDVLGQQLTAIKLDLAWLKRRATAVSDGALVAALMDKLAATSQLVDTTIRTVQKIASDLRPTLLEKLGLAVTLEHEARDFAERAGVRCACELTTHPLDLDDTAATGIFRIFQETLTNIGRHAHATDVSVRLSRDAAGLVLEVCDNGCGIAVGQVAGAKSFGLLGMSERTRLLGGQLDIKGVPGAGTTVTLTLPSPP